MLIYKKFALLLAKGYNYHEKFLKDNLKDKHIKKILSILKCNRVGMGYNFYQNTSKRLEILPFTLGISVSFFTKELILQNQETKSKKRDTGSYKTFRNYQYVEVLSDIQVERTLDYLKECLQPLVLQDYPVVRKKEGEKVFKFVVLH